jgi:hypothetical protein
MWLVARASCKSEQGHIILDDQNILIVWLKFYWEILGKVHSLSQSFSHLNLHNKTKQGSYNNFKWNGLNMNSQKLMKLTLAWIP